MNQVTSSDGTSIAFDRIGSGPPLILVDGALCYRASGPNGPLAARLAGSFTVYTYDRRGRGDSGDAPAYDPARELEDLAALINEAGGSASMYGISSGAALVLDAANRGLVIEKVAVYEPPFVVDDSRPPVPDDLPEQIAALIADGRRGEAVKRFMTTGVRVPKAFVAVMPIMPAWKKLKGVAHTLPYDLAFVRDYQHGTPLPADTWDQMTMPSLVVGGAKSPTWMQRSVEATAAVVPHATYHSLPGQTHLVKPAVLAPVLEEFFAG